MKTFFSIGLFVLSTTIFAQFSDSLEITKISFEGLNKTKKKVVFNELTIKVGDRISISDFDSILKNNLNQIYNLQLFNEVSYNVDGNSKYKSVYFKVQERWYVWPIPIFSLADRNPNAWLQKWDFNRIDYGIHLAHYNFRGRNEKLKSNIQLGYNQKYEFFYTKPYLDKKQKFGLNLSGSHFRSHFIDYGLKESEIQFKDFSNVPIKVSYIEAGLFRRKNVSDKFGIDLNLQSLELSDSVFNYNPDFFNETKNLSVSLNFSLISNRRNNFSYPLKGHYIDFEMDQRIGLNSKNSSLTEFNSEFNYYKPLSSKIYFSTGLNLNYKITKNNYFYDAQALGYKKFVRGMEYYVINGNFYILSKNSIKLNLVKNKNLNLNFIKSKKFNSVPIRLYLDAFTDAGIVNDKFNNVNNTLSNKLLFGTGIGLHFVTYYDRVLVLEYSFNNLGENGFFISTKFPI